jgi:nanoRNase/pAp phosphatase (c-di-AMP/oligoRNAs hydrolase)
MNNTEKHKLITELLGEAQSIAIVPSKMGGSDSFCAGAGLFHILKSNNKKVSFIYPGLLPEGSEEVFSKEDITSDLKARELVVAVDYRGTKIDKIQYLTVDDIFYLKMASVPQDFDVSKITTNLMGANHDVFVVIGARMPQDLGQTYTELEHNFANAEVINLDITDRNTRFGHFNIVDPLKDSMSLLTMHTAIEWDFKITAEAAKAFLMGISKKITA